MPEGRWPVAGACRWFAIIVGVFSSVAGVQAASDALSVFPGAHGFGAMTRAGRGGEVVRVTTLADAGPGSLRAAIERQGPRIVLFEVGGSIELKSKLYITSPYLTVAGQTAPPPGIQLKNAGIYVRTHDVLIQHLRIRPGDAEPGVGALADRHALAVLAGSYNVVIDHNTLQWATDENAAIWSNTRPIRDVTFSNNLIAECLVGGAYGMAIGTNVKTADFIDRISVLGNLFAHNTERQPKIGSNVRAVVANNVAYNGRRAFTQVGSAYGPSKVSFHANLYLAGPTSWSHPVIEVSGALAGNWIYLDSGSQANLSLGAGEPWPLFPEGQRSALAAAPPVIVPGLAPLPTSAVQAAVTGGAGAWPALRDSAERRVVSDVLERTGRPIQRLLEAGGWPDDYARASERSLQPFLPAVPHADDDNDGYSNIEELLHQFAAQVEGGSQSAERPAPKQR